MRYVDQHAYETPTNGKNKLKVGHVFDSATHCRKVFHDMIIRGGFDIERIYND